MADLVENPFSKDEDQADPRIPTASLQIYSFIKEYLARGKDTHVDRASSATMPPCRRWLTRQGVEGKPLTPRKIVNFTLGDLTEKTLLFFIKQALVGPGKLYSEVDFGKTIGKFTFQGKEIEVYEQETMSFDIDGIPVTAHIDGLGKRNSDDKWELIECKSASDYGFKSFRTDGPEDYVRQAHACMLTKELRAKGVMQTRYFYLRKQTGHLWDVLINFDEKIAAEVINDYRLARGDKMPPKIPLEKELFRGKPTGNVVPSWRCQYCPYTTYCHGEPKTFEWKEDQFGFLKPKMKY